MVKMLIGYPPFILAFGIDIVALVELLWPTTWVENFKEEDNDVVLLPEQEEREDKRKRAITREIEYKRRMIQIPQCASRDEELEWGRHGITECVSHGSRSRQRKAFLEMGRPVYYPKRNMTRNIQVSIWRMWHADNLCKYYQWNPNMYAIMLQ